MHLQECAEGLLGVQDMLSLCILMRSRSCNTVTASQRQYGQYSTLWHSTKTCILHIRRREGACLRRSTLGMPAPSQGRPRQNKTTRGVRWASLTPGGSQQDAGAAAATPYVHDRRQRDERLRSVVAGTEQGRAGPFRVIFFFSI